MLTQMDIEQAKSVNLLELIGQDTKLHRVARTRGGEYAGPCPFCGGKDRLRVQPEEGLWWCRRCSGEHWQDAIAYVEKRDGVGFVRAVERLFVKDEGRTPLKSAGQVMKEEGKEKEKKEGKEEGKEEGEEEGKEEGKEEVKRMKEESRPKEVGSSSSLILHPSSFTCPPSSFRVLAVAGTRLGLRLRGGAVD